MKTTIFILDGKQIGTFRTTGSLTPIHNGESVCVNDHYGIVVDVTHYINQRIRKIHLTKPQIHNG